MAEQEIIEPKSMRKVEFDTPIKRGDEIIESVQIRKPSSGELRGLSMIDVARLEMDSLEKILPRVTIPALTREEIAKMDPSDVMAMGLQVAGFLMPRREGADFQNG